MFGTVRLPATGRGSAQLRERTNKTDREDEPPPRIRGRGLLRIVTAALAYELFRGRLAAKQQVPRRQKRAELRWIAPDVGVKPAGGFSKGRLDRPVGRAGWDAE